MRTLRSWEHGEVPPPLDKAMAYLELVRGSPEQLYRLQVNPAYTAEDGERAAYVWLSGAIQNALPSIMRDPLIREQVIERIRTLSPHVQRQILAALTGPPSPNPE